MKANKDIRYTGREFDDLKKQLVEFAKNYFPDTYTNFSETSVGMMFMEMAAYVGDILSFYTDTNIQEAFIQYAKNPVGIYSLAYMMGYRPKVTTASIVELHLTQKVDKTPEGGPDYEQACIILEGSVFSSNTNPQISFITTKPVNFRYNSFDDPTEIYYSELESKYYLTKKVKAYSGKINSTSITFSEYKKFQTVNIEDTDIIKILDVVDSDGNYWYEVPFLGQSKIFDRELGVDGTGPNILTLKDVPRRFVTRFTDKKTLQLQFGSGKPFIESSKFVQPLQGETDMYDVAYDPVNFMYSDSYGIAPVNTTLTIQYVTGGGIKSSVEAETINIISKLNVVKGTVVPSIVVSNPEPARGGKGADTLDEIKQNSLRAFAEQKRIVTPEDYCVRALGLPSDFGVVTKTYAVSEERESGVVDLYVLSSEVDGSLSTASSILKSNLATYLSEYKMMTDTVRIKDAFIVNLGIQYDVVLQPGYGSNQVLFNCSAALKDYFSIDNMQINRPIILSEIYTLLDRVPGVQTVRNIKFNNLTQKDGEGYSIFNYDIAAATKNGIVYPSCDPCIFEIKYPDEDIVGRVVTL